MNDSSARRGSSVPRRPAARRSSAAAPAASPAAAACVGGAHEVLRRRGGLGLLREHGDVLGGRRGGGHHVARSFIGHVLVGSDVEVHDVVHAVGFGRRGDEHEDRQVANGACDVGEEAGEPVRDVVDIFDAEQHRLRERGSEQPPERPARLVRGRLASLQAERVRQPLHDAVAIGRARQDPLERLPRIAAARRRRRSEIRRSDDRFDQRGERPRSCGGDLPVEHHGRAGMPRGERPEELARAGPRRPDHRDARVAPPEVVEALEEIGVVGDGGCRRGRGLRRRDRLRRRRFHALAASALPPAPAPRARSAAAPRSGRGRARREGARGRPRDRAARPRRRPP